MAQQDPHGRVAETSDFAGPYLRFNSGTGPGQEGHWTGSVLCLTREGGNRGVLEGCSHAAVGNGPAAAPAGPAAHSAAPTAGNASWEHGNSVGGREAEGQPPSLILTDCGVAGDSGQPQRLAPVRLDCCLGWTFWRFDLDLQLSGWQRPVRYLIEAGGRSTRPFTFWLPGAGQPMHWGYYSCNGLSSDVADTAPERADPTYLWRDVLQLHAAFPLHCMVGGGDQLYNDGVWQCPSLKAWGTFTDRDKKCSAAFSPEMEAEATSFYLTNYVNSFGTPDIDLALAQIPQIMVWDDHDIWDGYGSYEPATQDCPVFQGLFSVARRFYLLFQQHTTDALNAQRREFLRNDGRSFHSLKFMGPQVALLVVDMRSQRSQSRVMPQVTFDLLKQAVEEMPAGPQHLVVLSGIPLIFPKVPAAETVLGCMGKLFRTVPLLENLARSSGLLDRFDQPEILDDLRDGWVADVHTEERLQFIRLLQDFSLKRGLRVSILSGDAHVGGVGRLYSRPKIRNQGDDPLFMCQIISSAIVNAPPPHPVVKMLMRTNFASNVDARTREKLVRAFYPYHPRTDKLIAQRNWCDVSLALPPFTAPTVPQDPQYCGLRFVLRVENPRHRRGYADETYLVLVPRHPAARPVALPGTEPGGGAAAAGAGTVAMEGELKETRRLRSQQRLLAAAAGEPPKGGAGAPLPEARREVQLEPRTPGATLV